MLAIYYKEEQGNGERKTTNITEMFKKFPLGNTAPLEMRKEISYSAVRATEGGYPALEKLKTYPFTEWEKSL